jgi:hypothetical protein
VFTTSIPFEKAIARTEARKRHLLLGNGFSIGAHASFGYPRLYDHAVTQDAEFAKLFPQGGGTNFEVALRDARTEHEADLIRAGLIKAVAAVHPNRSIDLTAEQGIACRQFLEKFAGRTRPAPGWVFTTNYDMLLHWVISAQPRTVGSKRQSILRLHDGFDHVGRWHEGAEAQIFYLHGAVHVFEFPFNERRKAFYTEMLRYARKRPLLSQVEELLAAGNLPVFVAEGSAVDKIRAQRKWTYLKNAMRRFRVACSESDSVLFTFGHSFGESDSHIAECVAKGLISRVCIGVFSDSDRTRAETLAEAWAAQRSAAGVPDFKVYTFDARQAPVWKILPESE